jgi:hypothetical protein
MSVAIFDMPLWVNHGADTKDSGATLNSLLIATLLWRNNFGFLLGLSGDKS